LNNLFLKYFEDNGVPHIKADNKEIGSFALGYLHGVDRIWQMDYMRRLAQGRLSEIFGKFTYKLDETFRTFGFRHL
jgi:penicillin amidase